MRSFLYAGFHDYSIGVQTLAYNFANATLRFINFGSSAATTHHFSVKLRPSIAQVMLALLLLLSQQMGLVHVISHLSSDIASSSSQDNKQLPAETQCKHCLAFASIGSALANSPLILFADSNVGRATAATPSAKLFRSAFRAFDSRAPPALF